MRGQSFRYWEIILVILFLLMTVPVGTMAKEVTLIGEINDTNQLVADGEIYDIADTPAGDDLVKNYISARVKVIGTITDGEELKIIRVTSFQEVDE